MRRPQPRRRRDPDDPDELFIAAEQPEREMLVYDPGYKHPRKDRRPPPAYDVAVEPEAMLEPSPKQLVDRSEQYRSSDAEFDWQMLDDEEGMARVEEAVEAVKATKAKKDQE